MLQLPIPIGEFASRLLSWYRNNRRDLPWRKDPDPYRIWVSEVMLQQTQVGTALPYFREFLKTYPTLESLARAQENQILSSWSGLGYYSRARNLHRAAQIVLERHGGEFPRDYREARQLPGIGRYTAGAILSIAYGEPLPILDGNIRRLFARYLKIEQDLGRTGTEELWKLLTELVREPSVAKDIGDFNQALMEIGSLVCTPRNPQCHCCPLAESCRARKEGMQEVLPRVRKQRSSQEFHYTVALISRGEEYLLKQNSQETFLRGFWEFPRVGGQPTPHIAQTFRKVHDLDLKVNGWAAPVTHQITFRKLNFHPALVSLQSPAPEEHFTWAKPGENDYPISSYVRKILRNVE
ncbi:A/G-specific adenine glycosylase [Acidobacteria bacterium AH-259-A15]|nr:A/G-specific adenine glycosylase [Acidobacteria bacterium AH-259-A15]